MLFFVFTLRTSGGPDVNNGTSLKLVLKKPKDDATAAGPATAAAVAKKHHKKKHKDKPAPPQPSAGRGSIN